MASDKLVLGSAGKKAEGYITVDIDPEHKPDVVHDLRVLPWPFKDNQFKEIIAHHVLEHMEDLMDVMKELHRICHPEGVVYIEVPHHSSWCANTPTHKLRFNAFAFDGWCVGTKTWKTGKKFIMIKKEITFHRAYRRYFLHKIFNRFPMAYERFWAYIIQAEHLKVWLRPQK